MSHKPVQEIEVGEIISFYEIGGECHMKTPFELAAKLFSGTPVAYVFGANRPYKAEPGTEDRTSYVFVLEESAEDDNLTFYKLVAKTLDSELASRLFFEADEYYRQRHFAKHPHLKHMYYGTYDQEDFPNK